MQWKTYRTRFLVKAKQLKSNLSFTDPLGRQHSGRRGDYLVESSEGVISIAPKKIFEDIYVAISDDRASRSSSRSSKAKFSPEQNSLPLDLPIPIPAVETLKLGKFLSHLNGARQFDSSVISRARRKSPQPVRPSPSRLVLM
jgi:hypothetical protein